jgi:AMMECR1 domain-containing protein
LPQVATEHQWSPERFLEEACRKAGLSPEAWKSGARIEAFTAEVFGES